MEQDEKLYQEITSLLFFSLMVDSPVLSGNMKAHISIENVGKNSTTICITAPSYDLALWKKTNQIKFTNKYDYAASVNDYGGFFSNNSSKHWVNRTLKKICDIKAREYNGEVICDVEL